jgi:hypothetical protein
MEKCVTVRHVRHSTRNFTARNSTMNNRHYSGHAEKIADGIEIKFNDYLWPWRSGDWITISVPCEDALNIICGGVRGDRLIGKIGEMQVAFVRTGDHTARMEVR